MPFTVLDPAVASDLGESSGESDVLASHWSPTSLASQLNLEWRRLCQAPASNVALARWSALHPVLAGYHDLPDLLCAVAREPASRDALLLALLELARAGERLAGRVVLQAMLGKAVRLATSIASRPDVLGDRQEAQAAAVAALWQVIATYPLAARPRRVAANLALDTLALMQRGHTGSSHHIRTFPEQPVADPSHLLHGASHAAGVDQPGGPVDAELLVLLAWSVREGVLTLAEARLLARVYGCDASSVPAKTVAAELGVSWPALRQRCHRLARRVGRAAVAAGINAGTDVGDQGRSSAVLAAV